MSGVCDFLEVVAGCRVPAQELALDTDEVMECRGCGSEIRDPHVFWGADGGLYCRQCAYRDPAP